MTGYAARFFGTAIAYAIFGMALGLHMGLTQDHTQMPTHAHILLVGWVTFAIFGVFYHLFPAAAANSLTKIHFWLAQMSFVTLVTALYLLFSGNSGADPIAGIASIGLITSMLIFAAIAWPVLRGVR